jgi:hypothetical protein
MSVASLHAVAAGRPAQIRIDLNTTRLAASLNLDAWYDESAARGARGDPEIRRTIVVCCAKVPSCRALREEAAGQTIQHRMNVLHHGSTIDGNRGPKKSHLERVSPQGLDCESTVSLTMTHVDASNTTAVWFGAVQVESLAQNLVT